MSVVSYPVDRETTGDCNGVCVRECTGSKRTYGAREGESVKIYFGNVKVNV